MNCAKLFFVIGMMLLMSTPPTQCERTALDGTLATTMVRVLANPENYDGKRLQLKGYYTSGVEYRCLLLTKEHAEIGDLSNAIWIESPGPEVDKRLVADIKHNHVTVIGIFRYGGKHGAGHLGAYIGALERITLLQPLPRTPIKND